MKLHRSWAKATPLFDDECLVSCAGLVPVMALAEQAGLTELIAERVRIGKTRVGSAGVNPAGKATSIIAGMAASADSIDDLQVIRSVLHMPSHWPWADRWLAIWTGVFGHPNAPPQPA